MPATPDIGFLLYFLHNPSAVRNKNQSSMLNSSITSTSVFLSLATCTVPSSRVELHSMSSEKKLRMVVHH